jgi:carbon monoxide dehydrogenase subunit G
MVEARSDVTLPVPPAEAFAAVADLDHADWLPAVRGVRHIGGPQGGVGARYEVEAGFVGRHLRGVLVCRELNPPKRMVMELEDGLDLTITVDVAPVSGGCSVEIAARYSVGAGPLAAAVERASQGAARRETARACEQLAARFGRKTGARRSA